MMSSATHAGAVTPGWAPVMLAMALLPSPSNQRSGRIEISSKIDKIGGGLVSPIHQKSID
jgi:hypothetical protein